MLHFDLFPFSLFFLFYVCKVESLLMVSFHVLLFYFTWCYEHFLMFLKVLHKLYLKLLYGIITWDEYSITYQISYLTAWCLEILFIDLRFVIIKNMVVNTFLYMHIFLSTLQFPLNRRCRFGFLFLQVIIKTKWVNEYP